MEVAEAALGFTHPDEPKSRVSRLASLLRDCQQKKDRTGGLRS